MRYHVGSSFMTWSPGTGGGTSFRLDRMRWGSRTPRPDLDDLPGETPARVVLPYERRHDSAHRQRAIAARLEPELGALSRHLGGGAPLRPRRIEMPEDLPG